APRRQGLGRRRARSGSDLFLHPRRRTDPVSANSFEILLVEDNPDDLELAQHALKKNHIANEIRVARDGAGAVDYLFSTAVLKPPRLVLLDLKLPKVDGIEVLRKIKGDARTRNIPVVVLTSSRENS